MTQEYLRGSTSMYKINMDTIVQDSDPVLRLKSEPVSFPLQESDIALMEDMLLYVRDSRNEELAEKHNLQPANGIAAIQTGVAKQMIVIVAEDVQKDGTIIETEYALINPKLVAHSEKQVALSYGEGCLSVRDQHEGLVPRAWRIRIAAYDYLKKENVIINAKDLLSIVIQHELDHLNGILFYDRINRNNPWAADAKLKLID